jgi:hypothetical protein
MDDDDDDDDACVAPTARYGTYTNRLMAIASRQRIVRDEEEAWGEEEFNHGDSDEPDYQEEAEDEAEEVWGEGEDGDEDSDSSILSFNTPSLCSSSSFNTPSASIQKKRRFGFIIEDTSIKRKRIVFDD